MIKFLRKIRESALTNNRFSKYLLYAFGEIILVVVGILIALNINNANEVEKRRQKERVLLTEMIFNLQEDLIDLDYNVRGNKLRTNANERVLAALKNRTPMNDSLHDYYGNILGNFQLSENTAAWETLKSVGLDIISSDSLRIAISNLYTARYGYLENLEKGADDHYQWNHVYPQILAHINIDTLWAYATPVNHELLMDNREFQEVLKMNLFFRRYMQTHYEKVYSEVEVLIRKLENHVNALE